MDKLFFEFKRKLLLEGLLRSFLSGASAAFITAFVFSLVYHILVKRTPVLLLCCICGAAFIVAFVLSFVIKYRPTDKKVAVRIDMLGLKDRAYTMLENAENQSYMAGLQRKDAGVHIQRKKAGDMKLFFSKKMLCATMICFLLSATMLCLPYDILSFADPKDEFELKQEQIIKDLIEDLREEVKNSLLDDEVKDELDDVIDKLEQDLNKTDSELEQAGKIEDAKDEISDILDKLLSKNKIGAALQKYPLTKELGVAISKGDTQKVTTALDNLEKKQAKKANNP